MTIVGYPAHSRAGHDPITLDVYLGEPVVFEHMLEDMTEARIIYVGEIHTIERHHALQTQLLRELAAKKANLALGMEMFSVEQQPILSKWLASDEDLNGLIQALGSERWTNLKDYESLLITAKNLKIPILGLNAPDPLVKMVAAHGLDSLKEKQKELPPPEYLPVSEENDKLLRLRLRVHKAFQGRTLDNIVAAQGLRDAFMAHTIVSFLQSPEGKDKTMLVIAGSGHLNYGLGIPEKTERFTGLRSRILLATESGQLVLSPEELAKAAPVNISHEDLKFLKRPIADYLHILPLAVEKVIASEQMTDH